MREMSPRERELRENWLADTSAAQAGVVTWAQLIQGGLTRADVQRKVRRRELRRVHPRVYVDHTGPLPWSQRAWAALLYAGMPSALCWESAQERAAEVDGPIHVAIEQSRRVEPQEGIVLHRMTGLQKRMFGGRPPRLRLEDNVLAMAHHAETDLDVVALLAGVVGRRGVTARSMRAALERFPTMRRHRFVAALLGDLEAGACSVLEHGYLVRVERAHGLPPAVRQSPRRTPEGRQLRDAEYVDQGLVVELDGQLNHRSWDARGRDADRDLDDLALVGRPTVRLRWKQVYGSPCRTALRIAQILRRRGWAGAVTPCGPSCSILS